MSNSLSKPITAEYLRLALAGLSAEEQSQLLSRVLNTVQPIGAVNGQLAELIESIAAELSTCDRSGGEA